VPALLVALSLLGTHFFPWTEKHAVLKFSPPPAQDSPPPAQETQAANARVFLAVYCSGCHNQGRAKIDLDASVNLAVLQDRAAWEKVVRQLRTGKMPPPGGRWPLPSQEEQDSFITWIENKLRHESPESERLARWRSRRLLRSEYLNTIRDLCGIHFQPGSDFPEDDPAWKLTRDLPTLSPLLLKKYQAAAEQIVQKTLMPKTPMAFSLRGSDDGLEEVCKVPIPSKEEQAREAIPHFAYRAFRRPLFKNELKDLVAVYQRAENNGLGYDESIKEALKAVLTAPQFLFRMESFGRARPSSRQRQHELACRLSYFLWSSMPDEELFALADREQLGQHLQEQALRMLHDPRSRVLAGNLANFWLELDKLPTAGNALVHAARQETHQFVATIVNENRSVLEFLDADYTFVNEALARHYGIADIKGSEVRKVALSGKQRGGLITQAGVLMLISGFEESPVKRGKWILENLLDSPPLAPPSGLLQALDETRKVFQPGTTRQLMEQHRANPSCAACHTKMDALGISLENFDGNGAWRTKINRQPVDATGTLPGGESITGPDQLKAYLLGKKDLFVRSLSGKLLSYALGRKLEKADLAALGSIPHRVANQEHRFRSVLLEVVQSEPFQEVLAKVEKFTEATQRLPGPSAR
jgi:hypothetical protein